MIVPAPRPHWHAGPNSFDRTFLTGDWTWDSGNAVVAIGRRPSSTASGFGDRSAQHGSTRATTNWQEAVGLQKELIRAALQGSLPTHSHSIKLFAAVDDYLKAKKATANTQRAIDFDSERLEVVKRVLGDVRLVGDLLACDRGLSGQAAS